jgi:hypothetical protein
MIQISCLVTSEMPELWLPRELPKVLCAPFSTCVTALEEVAAIAVVGRPEKPSSRVRVAELMVRQLQIEIDSTRKSKPQSRSRQELRPSDGVADSGAEITAIVLFYDDRLAALCENNGNEIPGQKYFIGSSLPCFAFSDGES